MINSDTWSCTYSFLLRLTNESNCDTKKYVVQEMNQNLLNLCFIQSAKKVLTGLSNIAFFAHYVKSEFNESYRQGLEDVFLFRLVDFACSLRQGPRKTFSKACSLGKL